VIVVVGDEQYDFELPGGSDAQAFMKNGVLTVEVNE
jgi:HSP20 family molecular chaperone IbpA